MIFPKFTTWMSPEYQLFCKMRSTWCVRDNSNLKRFFRCWITRPSARWSSSPTILVSWLKISRSRFWACWSAKSSSLTPLTRFCSPRASITRYWRVSEHWTSPTTWWAIRSKSSTRDSCHKHWVRTSQQEFQKAKCYINWTKKSMTHLSYKGRWTQWLSKNDNSSSKILPWLTMLICRSIESMDKANLKLMPIQLRNLRWPIQRTSKWLKAISTVKSTYTTLRLQAISHKILVAPWILRQFHKI